MKDKIIDLLGLKYSHETKWNRVYLNDEFLMIYNKVTRECKVRYNINN